MDWRKEDIGGNGKEYAKDQHLRSGGRKRLSSVISRDHIATSAAIKFSTESWSHRSSPRQQAYRSSDTRYFISWNYLLQNSRSVSLVTVIVVLVN